MFRGRTKAQRCVPCRKIHSRRKNYRHLIKRGRIKNPGVGSGGAQWGPDNHQWKGERLPKYKGNYKLRCFRVWGNACVVPGCKTPNDRVQAHHVNGDRTQSGFENVVPVCHGHHWEIHSKRKLKSDELQERLFALWPEGRSKIAEKIREHLSDRQSEVKADLNSQSAATTRDRSRGNADCNVPTRPRQTAEAA